MPLTAAATEIVTELSEGNQIVNGSMEEDKNDGDNDLKNENAQKEQEIVRQSMSEDEARDWRKMFLSACRWFDLDQVRKVLFSVLHLHMLLSMLCFLLLFIVY